MKNYDGIHLRGIIFNVEDLLYFIHSLGSSIHSIEITLRSCAEREDANLAGALSWLLSGLGNHDISILLNAWESLCTSSQ